MTTPDARETIIRPTPISYMNAGQVLRPASSAALSKCSCDWQAGIVRKVDSISYNVACNSRSVPSATSRRFFISKCHFHTS